MQPNDHALLKFDLNIDSIKYQICQLLNTRNDELQAIVNDELQKAQVNLDALIREGVREAIKQGIKNAFERQSYNLTTELEPLVQKELFKFLQNSIKESE